MSARRRLRSLLGACAFAGAFAAIVACNAITGTGKYDLVDCPSGASGTCGDGGSGTSPTGQNGDAGSPQGGDSAAADSATPPVVQCGPGLAPVTLTVTGAGGSVSAKSGGNLTVVAGSTDTACLATAVELRTSGPTADWTGPSCKDGNSGQDRCELVVPSQGITVTAALR